MLLQRVGVEELEHLLPRHPVAAHRGGVEEANGACLVLDAAAAAAQSSAVSELGAGARWAAASKSESAAASSSATAGWPPR